MGIFSNGFYNLFVVGHRRRTITQHLNYTEEDNRMFQKKSHPQPLENGLSNELLKFTPN